MKLRLLLTLIATLSPALAETANPFGGVEADIKKAAVAFCAELRAERVEGLPSPAQMKQLAPHITPTLQSIIERARSVQDEQKRQQPDEKPDWIEGDLFSSLFEGVSTWETGEVFNAPTVNATVKIKQSYSEPNQATVAWTDTLVFIQQDKRWLVNDIIFGGDWAFNAGDSLRGRLPGGLKESQDHDSLDGNWRVAFLRDGDDLTRVTLTDKKGSAQPMVLFGDKTDEPCASPSWLVWSPDDRMLALRVGESPRFTSTRVYRLVGKQWKRLKLPEFYAAEKKTLAENRFQERDRLLDAEYWQDSSTLVIHYFGSFAKEDEGDGFDKLIRVRFDKEGKGRVVDAVDAPNKN